MHQSVRRAIHTRIIHHINIEMEMEKDGVIEWRVHLGHLRNKLAPFHHRLEKLLSGSSLGKHNGSNKMSWCARCV